MRITLKILFLKNTEHFCLVSKSKCTETLFFHVNYQCHQRSMNLTVTNGVQRIEENDSRRKQVFNGKP